MADGGSDESAGDDFARNLNVEANSYCFCPPKKEPESEFAAMDCDGDASDECAHVGIDDYYCDYPPKEVVPEFVDVSGHPIKQEPNSELDSGDGGASDDYAPNFSVGTGNYDPLKKEPKQELGTADGSDDCYHGGDPPNEKPEPNLPTTSDGDRARVGTDDYYCDYLLPKEEPKSECIDVCYDPVKEEPKSELGDVDTDAIDANCSDDWYHGCDPPEDKPEFVTIGDNASAEDGQDVGYDCSHCGSARESSGDNAVDCVQVKRETEGIVQSIECYDCSAAQGGFLTRIHRRSEEPPTTSIKRYGKKPTLSAVGTSLKFLKARNMGSAKIDDLPTPDGSFLAAVVDHSLELGRVDSVLTKYYKHFSDTEGLSVNHLIIIFFSKAIEKDAINFFKFCDSFVSAATCYRAERETILRSSCPLWFELRFARITASKAYDVMHCQTLEGALVESLLGARKFDSPAMLHGRKLEEAVLREVEKQIQRQLSPCGLLVHPDCVIFGASPDAICEEFIVEIKCPASEKDITRYIKSDGGITAKYLSQIQMQMHIFKKLEGFFCVASHDFEHSKVVKIVSVKYDPDYCLDMLEKCKNFWCQAVFPILKRNVE